MSSRSRRALLRALGAATVGLGGCQQSPDPTVTSTDSPATRTPAPSPSPTPTDSPTPTPSLRCDPVVPTAADSWPLPERSASNDAHAPDGPVFEAAQSVDWTVEPTVPGDVNSRPRAAYFGRPLLAGDRLYAVRAVNYGTDEDDPGGHALQARDPATGELLWSYRLRWTPTVPAVWGDVVLVGSDNTLYALDRQDGSSRGRREFPAAVDAVVPTADLTYVDVLGGEDRENEVYALGADHSTRWSRGFADGVRALAVGPDQMYVGLWGGAVHAFERSSGTPAWRRSVATDGAEGPTFVGSVVATGCGAFATTGDRVAAFDPDGRRRWRIEADFESTMATDGETLYGATHGDREDDWEPGLRALDAGSGDVRWERQYEATGGGVLADGVLYQPLADGLAAVDPVDGELLWQTTPKLSGLALDNETIYGTTGRTLVAMR